VDLFQRIPNDPAGNQVELFTDPEPALQAFSSEQFPAGFQTGALGLGHAVLVAHDLPAMEAFYTGVLGFGVTERLATRVGPISFRGVFLHCNARHHSLALFDLPLSRRLHHFMLQAMRLSDIGRAFERAQRNKVPLSLGLGQHPDPDGTFSFYGAMPSGFDFEIGAGTQAIDPLGWQVQATDVTSTWGHEPTLRLQLQMAAGLLARKLWPHGRETNRRTRLDEQTSAALPRRGGLPVDRQVAARGQRLFMAGTSRRQFPPRTQPRISLGDLVRAEPQ
jgi:biphenyl-2,3-diol 1,2-dioxygenase